MFLKPCKPEFWTSMRENPAYAPLLDCIKRGYATSNKRTTIQYHEFMSYWRTGTRQGSDGAYFERKKYINSLIFLTLIYPENEDYLHELQNAIWDLCNDFTWERSAHVTWEGLVNMTEPKNLEDKHIALSGTTIAAKMALVKLWLGDRLDNTIRRRITYEIKYKYMLPFQEKTYRWENMESNWACTCAGQLGIALMLEFPEEFLELKPRFDHSMECFLRSFSKEGFCLEGVGYWAVIGTFITYAQCLSHFTNGKENYLAREQVHDIARFLNYSYLQKNYSVAFSDCHPVTKCNLGLGHLLHSIYPDVKLLPRECYTLDKESLDDALLWWELISECFLYFQPEYCKESEHLDAEASDFYAEDAAWYIHKGKTYSLAAKAGHNAEPHNHNDIGSFHLATGNGQQLLDLGPSLYTINAFVNEYRYQIFGNSSLGHNLPIIDDIAQMYGKEFHGTMTPIENGVFLDFRQAYPHETLTALNRTLICKEKSVMMKDCFGFSGGSHTITERFIICEKPVLTEKGAAFGDVKLEFDTTIWSASVHTETHTGNSISCQNTREIYVLDLTSQTYKNTEFVMEIHIRI